MPAAARTRELRPEVKLENEGADTSISFAHWTVSLPSEAIRGNARLLDFLNSRRVAPETLDPEGLGIFALLNAQGCFLPESPDKLTPGAVLKLFQPLRSLLYAEYYAHPLWARLRSGAASRAELTAWMVHNYHISRSAGVIAARMAATTRDPGLRAFFRDDALEEYWHCDSFYFVEQSGIRLTSSDVKNYVPLPASTAFEDHALRAAEEDPLGHLLIAYFQESSIIFRQDSERFYDTVEANYDLSGAFGGWRKHMTLDLDHDHAGELAARFNDDSAISLQSAKASVRKVQLAQFFLLNALDQIAKHANIEDGLSPRLTESMTGSSFRAPADNVASLSRSCGLYLVAALRDAAFRALSLAQEHDQIIAAGRLASQTAAFVRDEVTIENDRPWRFACRNFLMERAADPNVFLALAPMLVSLIAERCSELRSVADSIAPREPERNNNRNADIAFCRLRELIELASVERDLPPLAFV